MRANVIFEYTGKDGKKSYSFKNMDVKRIGYHLLNTEHGRQGDIFFEGSEDYKRVLELARTAGVRITFEAEEGERG